MSDQVVRYVVGQFTPPNIDNVYKRGPTQHTDITDLNIQNTVVGAYLIHQAKGAGSAISSRLGAATGNRSIGRTLEFLSTSISDIGILSTGFGSGGVYGLGLAATALGVQKGIQAFDINLERWKATIDSNEQERRSGFVNVDKRSEYR